MAMKAGQALREARLRRGVDLYEVHRVTKINVESLRAMEEDRWDEVPAPGPQAVLEVYAQFLGLDQEALGAEPDIGAPRTGGHTRSVLLAVGFAAVVGVMIGLIGFGQLGGSGGGGGPTVTTGAAAQPTTTTTIATTAAPPVSVQITTHALVWVCLVDQRQRPVIDGLSLVRDQTVGPYDGKAFDVTFGNGKVDLTVNAEPVKVPPIAEPFGYRITPEGATRLPSSAQPTCT